MKVNLYDNLKGESVEIYKDKVIKIFNCGPTVSDLIHIGHFRNALLPDILKRVLIENGYKNILYITNISNISTKIYNRAKNTNEGDWEYIGSYFTQQWIKDLSISNILSPNIIIPDTRHIERIIKFIANLIDKEAAYICETGVKYKCSYLKKLLKDKGYDSSTSLFKEIYSNDEDFILWELANDEVMTWDSPWGKGRPGKHIPCSDVIDTYCDKDDFLIHSSGDDLYYHHSCEFAQNIVGFKNSIVSNVWIYNALVNVDDNKMGKSLGNSIPIRTLLKTFSNSGIRWYLLSTNFENVIRYSEDQLIICENEWKKIKLAIDEFNNEKISKLDQHFYEEVMKILNNNLDTKNALKMIKEVFECNKNKEVRITAAYLLRVLGFEV